MPKDSGMVFVVIQHLDPNHVGIMPELLRGDFCFQMAEPGLPE
jgi:flavorubredoxin